MSSIFIFHGTEGYPEENWFPWLKEKLEALGHKVFVPQFPSPVGQPAEITEWFKVLEKYEPDIDAQAILIGHSLGGVFALRVLEKIKQPVNGAFFTGTPIGVKPILNYDRDCLFSGFSFDWPTIKNNAKNFAVFQSDNDPYVSLGNGQALAKELGIELSFIPGAGHFNRLAGYLKFEELLNRLTPLL